MSMNKSASAQTAHDNEQFSFALDPIVDPIVDSEVDSDIKDIPSFEKSNEAQETKLAIKTESIWVSMPNGEQLHMRHLLPLLDTEEVPKRVFMLHGEVECGRIFYHESGKGVAYHFAEQGYEVFVADLGGRGRSLGCDGEPSTLTVYDIVTDAIPRLLRAATQHSAVSTDDAYANSSSVAPTIWVAHGFGGVMLSAAWARMSDSERTATQMIFFGARRKLQAKRRITSAFVKAFCHPLTAKLVNWHNAFPATRMHLGSADENTHWFRVYADWISSDDWRDSEDGFDYRAALEANPIPPTLHFAAAADKIYSDVADVRAFINELGRHDARMLVAGQIGESKREYDHLSLLLDPAAVNDVFTVATDWLVEQQSLSSLAVVEAAVVEPTIAQESDSDLSFYEDSVSDDASLFSESEIEQDETSVELSLAV